MKKTVLLAVLAAMLFTPLAAEQGRTEEPGNAVSVDVLLILLNWYKVSYERRVTDSVSVIGGVQYTPDLLWGLHGYDKVSYLNFTGGGRYYWGSLLKDAARDVNIGKYSKHIPKMFTDALGGFYVGLSGMYSHAVIDDTTDSDYVARANAYGLEATLGCKYIFSDDKKLSFYIEPYFGGRLQGGSYSYEDGAGNSISKPADFDDGIHGGTVGGLNLGITF